ncbi:malonate decarboxylase subunit [Bradyrhizobium sacchari]|uniref:Malonate transporter n=1 Tax=Bradyrhizobium sacchari TaxID=1399419 RepID=A0A560JS43_9BRAD|nr:AEC family transporter [Bradyrhizobium sacchari]OPY98769.1 malonate decarboxylase subunit [Bradyrhizobium sacchari]TWB60227.1 malonate transporter [Bradyrhizobium sacchari]TWB73963.1 malonate transporter [Bradyrhizobium sacchari]
MTSNVILMALVPVFFVLLLGYSAGRFRIVDNGHVEGLNALVMDFALPASLFAATASAPHDGITGQAPVFLVFGVTMLVIYAGWYWFERSLLAVTRSDAAVQALTVGFPNLAGVGLPILSTVLGPAGVVPVAVALATGSILVSPLTLVIAEISASKVRGTEAPASPVLTAIRRAFAKPVVWAPALGVAFSLSGLKLDPLVHACLVLIGNAAAGVALFLTGLVLSAQSLRIDWRVIAATGAADILRPLLAVAIVYGFHLGPDVAKTAILLAALPSGFFGILFAVNYRLDSATVGSMVIASTGFSVVTLAIAIATLFPH